MEWPRAILHLDMDAFFVNVHLLDHPEDRGLPLAIGGKPGTRGVVASASYEARQRGVRSAMPATQAQRRCPELKFAEPDWPRIEASSREVMRRLAEFGPLEPLSVDQASAIDDPVHLARESLGSYLHHVRQRGSWQLLRRRDERDETEPFPVGQQVRFERWQQ